MIGQKLTHLYQSLLSGHLRSYAPKGLLISVQVSPMDFWNDFDFSLLKGHDMDF